MGRPKKTQTVNRETVSRKQRTVKLETENAETENRKTFLILTDKLWFIENDKIKIGETMSDFMSGNLMTIEVKEILIGENYKTWTLAIDKENKYFLLKTSKKL